MWKGWENRKRVIKEGCSPGRQQETEQLCRWWRHCQPHPSSLPEPSCSFTTREPRKASAKKDSVLAACCNKLNILTPKRSFEDQEQEAGGVYRVTATRGEEECQQGNGCYSSASPRHYLNALINALFSGQSANKSLLPTLDVNSSLILLGFGGEITLLLAINHASQSHFLINIPH